MRIQEAAKIALEEALKLNIPVSVLKGKGACYLVVSSKLGSISMSKKEMFELPNPEMLLKQKLSLIIA